MAASCALLAKPTLSSRSNVCLWPATAVAETGKNDPKRKLVIPISSHSRQNSLALTATFGPSERPLKEILLCSDLIGFEDTISVATGLLGSIHCDVRLPH
jgi:hypothetical protein